MLKLGNATLKYLNFIDIVQTTHFDFNTLDNNQLIGIQTYLKQVANVDLDIGRMYTDGQEENKQIISVKIIDPTKSFKFNNNIILITNERVINSIKNTTN